MDPNIKEKIARAELVGRPKMSLTSRTQKPEREWLRLLYEMFKDKP